MPYLLIRGYEDADDSRFYLTVVIDLDHVKDLADRIEKIAKWGKLWEVESAENESKWNQLKAVIFWDPAPRWYILDLYHYEWCDKNLDMGRPVILAQLPEEVSKADAGDPYDKYIRVESAMVVYDGTEPWEISWRGYMKNSGIPLHTEVLNLKELDKIEQF